MKKLIAMLFCQILRYILDECIGHFVDTPANLHGNQFVLFDVLVQVPKGTVQNILHFLHLCFVLVHIRCANRENNNPQYRPSNTEGCYSLLVSSIVDLTSLSADWISFLRYPGVT